MAKQITVKEEKAIVKAIEEGKSLTQVAKKFKRSVNTISRYAKKNGIETARAKTKKATEASQFYNKERRMNLLKMGFEKHKELLPDIENLRDLKDWDMGVAILIDKQRLEEGEPTDISKSDVKNTNTVNPESLTQKDVETLAEEIRKKRNECP